MAAVLNQSIVSVTGSWNFSNAGPPQASSVDNLTWSKIFTSGSGASAANKMVSVQYTIAASATQKVDINGSATDPLLGTPAITKIRAILVVHPSTSLASSVTFGPSASQPCSTPFGSATDKVKIYLDGAFLLTANTAAGFAAVGAASDAFDIVNADGVNAATVQVLFIGE